MSTPLERAVSRVLRVGVLSASVLVALGLAFSFVRHPEYRSSPEALGPLLAPGAERSVWGLLSNLPAMRGQSFVLLGLLLLVATPVARVGLVAVQMARAGDRRIALAGFGVLLLILVSFVLGHTAG